VITPDPTTSVRTASFNIRHKSADDVLHPSRLWSKRGPQVARVIKDVAPSVLGVQECNGELAASLTQMLGPNWTFWGTGTAKIMWRADKWVAIDHREFKLKSTALPGFPSTRPLTCVRLRSIATGADFWAVSTHLAVNFPGEATWREAQAREIVGLIGPTLEGSERAVIFGDFNSPHKDGQPQDAVRRIFAIAGYVNLRAKLTDAQMDGDSRNSRNGWGVTPREGIWIDDVLTSADVHPYAGTLVITGTPDYDPHASDHNLVRASVKIATPLADTPEIT
jgi:endonuclease/exonuclease/phosphatase family metal-dependent hydrolase